MHRMHISSLSRGGGPYMCGVHLHMKGRKHVFDAWFIFSPLGRLCHSSFLFSFSFSHKLLRLKPKLV